MSETRAGVKITPREKRRLACRLFSRGVIFTRARVSLVLLSLRKNGELLVVYFFFFREEPLCTTPSWSNPRSVYSCALLAFFIWVLLSARLAYTFVSHSALLQLYITGVYWEQDRQGFRFDRSSSVNAVKSNPFTSGNPIRKPFKTLYTVLCTLIGDYPKTVYY